MKVNIKNYQAVKDVELEFPPGITAIVGNSNNGKSSIIRAIEAAINNKGGKSFINYDADQCEVNIVDGDADITWVKSKKPGKSHYVINGKQVNKIGQKQIPEVAELLNMDEVEINKERFRLNFWKQLDYPFLVGKTPYQLFDFISQSKEQDIIRLLQTEKQSELKDTHSVITTTQAQVDTYTSEIVEAEEKRDKLQSAADFDLAGLEQLLSNYTQLADAIDLAIDTEDQIVEHTVVVDDITQALNGAQEKLATVTKFMPAYEALSNAIEQYISTGDTMDDLLDDITDYDDKIELVEEAIKHVELKLTNIYSLADAITALDQVLEEYDETVQAVTDKQNEIKEYELEIEELSSELGKFEVCPYCDSPLDTHTHN